MPLLGLYSWGQYTLPAGIPTGALTGNTHGNDPAGPGYSSSNPSWVGETFTFNGGPPSMIDITDDDGDFEDGYVETGAAQTLTSAVTIDGTTYPAGSVVENEFSLFDAGGNEIYVVRINGVNVGFTYRNGQEPTAGDDFTATSARDGAPADSGDGSSSSEPYDNVICFAGSTRLDTPGGSRRVEDLRRGDLVCTVDAGPQPVLWVRSSEVPLRGRDDPRRPVILPRGCLGRGLPHADLVISPQHRLLIAGPALQARFGPAEAFAPAKGLVPLPGVRVMRGLARVRYFHVLLPQHAVIRAEGAATESFYPGAQALRALCPATRDSLMDVLAAMPGRCADYGPLARPVLSVAEALEWARGQRRAGRPGAARRTLRSHRRAA